MVLGPLPGSKQARGPPVHDFVGDDESTGYVEPAFVARKLTQQGPCEAPRGLITWLSDPQTLAPVAKLVDGRAYSVVCDHLGTPVLMLDEAGQRVWAAELTTWGEVKVVLGERADCPHRFLGQVEDSETGLYYNRYRHYDPRAGQYLCVDPIRLAGGLNSFAYVGDPLVEVDPLGLAKRGGPGDCLRCDPESGGFARGISPEEIESINRGFEGVTYLSGTAGSALVNASRYDVFLRNRHRLCEISQGIICSTMAISGLRWQCTMNCGGEMVSSAVSTRMMFVESSGWLHDVKWRPSRKLRAHCEDIERTYGPQTSRRNRGERGLVVAHGLEGRRCGTSVTGANAKRRVCGYHQI